MKKLWIFVFALFLVGCTEQDATESAETEKEEQVETEQSNARDAKQELEWILQNNESLHSPSKDLNKIVDYNTGEPLGVSIYYGLRDGFDNNKYRMNVKVGEHQGQFVVGWNAPNTHMFELDNTTPVQSITEERQNFIDPSDLFFEAMYEPTYLEEFKDDAYIQITAADIDQDNALEFILYGTAYDEETSWQMMLLEIYEYFPEQEQPFERVLQLTEPVFNLKPIRITPAGEIVVDVYRGDTYVVALCKDNEWYIVEDYYVNNGQHSGNRISLDASFKPDFSSAVRSPQNSWREQCRLEKCNPKDQPPLKTNVAMDSSSEADAATNENGADTVLQAYDEQQLGMFIQDYVGQSVAAKNTGDYSLVAAYIEPDSPVYKDMVKSVPATYQKGITMDHIETVVENISAETTEVYFTVLNTFEIFNSTYDGPVSFRSVYKAKLQNGELLVSELVSDQRVE